MIPPHLFYQIYLSFLEQNDCTPPKCGKLSEYTDSAHTEVEDPSSRYMLTASESKKEGNVLFNDALNTFYLRLYGVRHIVKDYSDSEKENPLPPHRLLFPINSKGSFICTIPQTYWHIPRPLLHQSWSTGWNEK